MLHGRGRTAAGLVPGGFGRAASDEGRHIIATYSRTEPKPLVAA